MKYKTCVSIAEKTPKKVKKMLDVALKKSDYAEIRFDFMKSEKIPETLEIVRKNLKKTVCTMRPKVEGGRFAGGEEERIAILKLIAEYDPFLLDVEYNTLRKNPRLVKYLKTAKTRLLVSWHDFAKTPSSAVLKKRMDQMSRFSPNVKIVSTAKKANDSDRMLALYGKKENINLISFAMGDLGRVSRILCLYLGSPYTYVSLGRAVAPGQFSVDEVKRITNSNRQSRV